MADEIRPLDLARVLAQVLKELHDCELSVQFWSRNVLQYARAVCEQKQFYSMAYLEIPITLLPILGARPADPRKARLYAALERARGLWLAASGLSASTVGRRVDPNTNVALGVRAGAVAAACNALEIRIPFLPPLLPTNRLLRQRLDRIAEHQQNQLISNAVRYIPKVFVEYHQFLKTKALRILQQFQPTQIFYEHFQNYTQRLFAYLGSESGATLNHVQTGGHVGESLISVNETKRLEYDSLLTYGWKLADKDHPFYAVRLEEFKKSYQEAHRNSDKGRVDILVVFNPVDSPLRQRRYTELIKSLSGYQIAARFPSVMLRPRGVSRYLSNSKQLRVLDVPDSFSIDQGRRVMAQLLRESRLVIQAEYPSTNFLESLFVDHPVIALRTDDQELTALAACHAKRLEHLGLLHRTTEDLRVFLERVDLEQWWRTVTADPDYQNFKNVFARSRSAFLASCEHGGFPIIT